MRILTLGILIGVLGATLVSYSTAASNRCVTGRSAGFIAIRSDPAYLVGTIPSKFTSDATFFSRRYSCRGQRPEVRRESEGFYQVRFPGLSGRVALSDAVSNEAVSSSVEDLGGGIYRISLRGPLVGGEVMSRRDVAFSIVLF